jgi:hypothetical protein
MRTSAIGAGSPADVINGVAIALAQCGDLPTVSRAWPRPVRALEGIARRIMG